MARKSKSKTQTTLPEAPFQHKLEVATLSRAIETQFDLQPDTTMLDRIAAYLGLEYIDALRFKGQIQPRRKEDWRISGRLTASLAQACVVSLEPVPEKIDEDLLRDLTPLHLIEQTNVAEVEIGAEDDADVFQDQIDIAAIALEELALALEPYPRAPDAALETKTFTEKGIAPLRDSDVKPFAKLAELKDRLAGKEP